LAMLAAGVSVAAPASAGCEQRPFVGYCDGPIQPDGSWQRCFNNQPVWNRDIGTWIGGSNCYQVGPGPDSYPWAPQYHIDP
ncbi:MAG: hypothetical protein QG597_4760, partial [Actinomycetota bacterium]|nr:hypothetical protein [Actinomycetota bacterium]